MVLDVDRLAMEQHDDRPIKDLLRNSHSFLGIRPLKSCSIHSNLHRWRFVGPMDS